MPGVIVPRKTVAELQRLLGEEDGEIQVSLSDSKIRFEINPGAARDAASKRSAPLATRRA